MNEIDVKDIIFRKDWNLLITMFSTKDVCKSLSFSEAMRLVEELFYENMQDDGLQQFALNLTFEIRENFQKQWEEDWKNDVFLGQLCAFLWLYDERYLCYKRAYDKLEDPPEALLLLLAGCNSAPGTPPISDLESEEYLTEALEKKLTYEAALKMRTLWRNKGDQLKEQYWGKLCVELDHKNIHTTSIVPDILVDSL